MIIQTFGIYARLLLPSLVMFYGFTMFYKFAPRQHPQFGEVWFSALVVTLALQWLRNVFVVYAQNVRHFQSVYGAFGGVMALLMGIYLSGTIIILGGCLSAGSRKCWGGKGKRRSQAIEEVEVEWPRCMEPLIRTLTDFELRHCTGRLPCLSISLSTFTFHFFCRKLLCQHQLRALLLQDIIHPVKCTLDQMQAEAAGPHVFQGARAKFCRVALFPEIAQPENHAVVIRSQVSVIGCDCSCSYAYRITLVEASSSPSTMRSISVSVKGWTQGTRAQSSSSSKDFPGDWQIPARVSLKTKG